MREKSPEKETDIYTPGTEEGVHGRLFMDVRREITVPAASVFSLF
jgi:hypothetical protein